ncbi:hypothetical protein POM88_033893 [Heracleum sosnowskyi]|uniref:GAG-pre-integrase domain-containing protein n=1 Tax=Heracleum sosnowskyi TaxID=360622 RepID=A0AAD8MBP6_9APIA|nr:hypothetical protein POM88_033893 [Heracleum sosnowskyi]
MWVLDSGCSRHMTGDRALLSNVVEKAGPGVTFGDNIKGITRGSGCLKFGNVIIQDVSIVEDPKMPSLQGVRKGDLFIDDLHSRSKDEVTCFYAKASFDESWLWHKKMSHLNFKTMNSLVKRELVRGLPQMEFTQEGLCEACQK